MWKNRFLIAATLVLPALIAGGCSEKKDDSGDKNDCSVGHESCDCTPESTCLTGLVCLSGKCVDGGAQGTGGNGTSQEGCVACWDSQCESQHNTCETTSPCDALTDCLLGCIASNDFIACPVGCNTQVEGATSESLAAYNALLSCARSSCNDECFTETVTGTGGADGTGGDPGNTGGAATGGAGTGGSGTGGSGTGGSGTGGSATTVHWLSFDESWADISEPENAALGVSGGLYAYGDGCADFDWDPITRCISGQLCSPGPDYENWGIALGFDFSNTGEEGEPANTKMPWDAAAQDVIGLAWEISGTAPGLQVWVTNMAPSWQGVCSADDCAIDGPPDGKESTLLNTVDQVLFSSSNFVKDYWGGSGVTYTFSRSNILALQFKMATVVSGSEAYFDFCVEQIGAVKVSE
jgi:hypothetical protein